MIKNSGTIDGLVFQFLIYNLLRKILIWAVLLPVIIEIY